jgi:hypothetical protein
MQFFVVSILIISVLKSAYNNSIRMSNRMPQCCDRDTWIWGCSNAVLFPVSKYFAVILSDVTGRRVTEVR